MSRWTLALAALFAFPAAAKDAPPAEAPAGGPVRYAVPSSSALLLRTYKEGVGAALAHDHAIRATKTTGSVSVDPAAPAEHEDCWKVASFVSSLTSAAPATVEAYRADVEGFVRWVDPLSDHGPSGVDRRVLRRWMAHLAERGYARRTVARKASSIRRYFGWLCRMGAIPTDPTVGLSAPKGEGRLPRVLTSSDVDSLLTPPAAAGRSNVTSTIRGSPPRRTDLPSRRPTNSTLFDNIIA